MGRGKSKGSLEALSQGRSRGRETQKRNRAAKETAEDSKLRESFPDLKDRGLLSHSFNSDEEGAPTTVEQEFMRQAVQEKKKKGRGEDEERSDDDDDDDWY